MPFDQKSFFAEISLGTQLSQKEIRKFPDSGKQSEPPFTDSIKPLPYNYKPQQILITFDLQYQEKKQNYLLTIVQ